MERKLVLIRHAKSDWGTAGLCDFDRPLNERGNRDAPVMGGRLREKNIFPDLIISSPARRAARTAALIAGQVRYDAAKIFWLDKLYHCPGFKFEEVLIEAAIPDEVQTLFLFAHNPGITDFANDTIPGLSLPDMPTCGIVAITFKAAGWNDYPGAKHNLLFFDYPKNK